MKFWVRLAKLCCAPASAWNDIGQDNRPVVVQYVLWLLPLMLFVLAAAVAGQTLHRGHATWNDLAQLTVALLRAAVVLLVQLTAVAFVLYMGAPLLGGARDARCSFALSLHASVGILAGSAVQVLAAGLFPLPLVLGAAWSVYLLLVGMPLLLKVSPRKSRVLGIIIVLVFMLISVPLSSLVERLSRSVPPVVMQQPAAEVLAGEGRVPDDALKASIESLLQANRNLDRAAHEAGTASEHNDPLAEAQAARDAVNALAAGAAGGAQRLPLTVTELTDWFPASIMGMKLRALQLEPWGGLSSQAIMARASYAPPDSSGRDLELSVLDPASVGSLLAESVASSGHDQREGETEVTVERSYRDGGRSISEVQWKDSPRAEVSYVLINGVRVMAQANGIDLRMLRDAVKSLSFDALEKNRLVPVRKDGDLNRQEDASAVRRDGQGNASSVAVPPAAAP